MGVNMYRVLGERIHLIQRNPHDMCTYICIVLYDTLCTFPLIIILMLTTQLSSMANMSRESSPPPAAPPRTR